MNLERDPRWGRNDEAYGEDPLLVTRLVSQFVNGMEGKDKDGKLLPGANGFHKTATTLKHYAANNSEVDRLTGSSDMDDRTLREYYTHAFRGIVQATQPGSVMSSYNRVNGVPAAADPYLIDTLLRQTFGFERLRHLRLRRDLRRSPATTSEATTGSRRATTARSTTRSATRSRWRPARTPTARPATATTSTTSTSCRRRSTRGSRR